MTMARSKLVDPELTRVYHCVSRCVRKAFLIRGEGGQQPDHARWLEARLKELGDTFAISVISYAVMSNHLHVLVRLDPDRARGWSAEEVAERWARFYPPKDARRNPIPITPDWLAGRADDHAWIDRMRGRLQSLSWFMKLLKEPLARMANAVDGVKGHFFEGRFRSVAVLDDAAVLGVAAYVDLNPLAAGLAETPETGEHASIKERVDHVAASGLSADLPASLQGDAAAIGRLGRAEQSHWLCPIDDRRAQGEPREGLFQGVSMSTYLQFIDHVARLRFPGKATLPFQLVDDRERPGRAAGEGDAIPRSGQRRRGRIRVPRCPPGRPGRDRLVGQGHRDALERTGIDEAIAVTLPDPARLIGAIDRAAFGDDLSVRISPPAMGLPDVTVQLKPGQATFEVNDLAPADYQVTLQGPPLRTGDPSGSFTYPALDTQRVLLNAGESRRIRFEK